MQCLQLSSNFEEEENAEFLPKVDHSVSWTKMMFTSKNPSLFVEKTLQKSIAKGYTWSNGQNGDVFHKQQVFKNPPTPSAAPSITIVIPARSEFS